VTLLALVTERRAAAPLLLSAVQQSINTSCLPGAQQQTRNSSVRRANDETDRQRERQTDSRPLHRPSSAYNASSVKNPATTYK